MLFVNDVWVNWFEGEENGYNICHFHEWRKDDVIELLEQVPLLKVTETLFCSIENNLAEIPRQILNDVFQKAYLRKNNDKITLDYCFIITDGKNILAVDTVGYEIPLRKSRLIPRQEQIVFELVESIEPLNYKENEGTKEYHILSPHPNLMHGLTRRERNLKQLLFIALDQLYISGNTAKIRYWYTEWQPEKYDEIQSLSFEIVWKKLFKEVQHSWSMRHEVLCEKIIKGQPFFEQLWKKEQVKIINKRS